MKATKILLFYMALSSLSVYSQVDTSMVISDLKSSKMHVLSEDYVKIGLKNPEVHLRIIAEKNKNKISFLNKVRLIDIKDKSIHINETDVPEYACTIETAHESLNGEDKPNLLIYYYINCDKKVVWKVQRITGDYITFEVLEFKTRKQIRNNKPTSTRRKFTAKII